MWQRDKGVGMKKNLWMIVVVMAVSSVALFAAAQRDGISVGLRTGSPFQIGVTGEYDFGDMAANATIGYWDGFLIQGGVDWNLKEPLTYAGMTVYPSIGGSFSLAIGTASAFALGGPVTFDYYLDEFPMKVSFKIGPNLMIAPVFDFDIVATVSALYLL
jgi:hypothetical protein